MGTNQQNLAALRAEVNGSLYYRGAMGSGLLDDKTLRGMAQMGFTTMAQGEAFNTALKRYPNLKGFMEDIGNQAVGNPRMDGLMRAVGSRYGTVLPYLSGDFADNPRVQAQLRAAIARNPDAVGRALSTYNGREDGPGKLETLLNNINNPPAARAAPVQAAAQTRAPAPRAAAPRAERPAPRAERPEAPAERPAAPARAASGADRPDPITTVAGAAAAAPSADAAAIAPAAGAAASSTITSAQVATMANGLADKLLEVFPDMANDIEGFRTKLASDQADTALQSRIAQNLTRNPQVVEQMMQMAASKDDSNNSALRQYGADTVRRLLNNPEQLADDQYVKDLSGKLSMASGGGGLLDSIKNIFSGVDFGGIGDTIMGFLQPLIDMFKDLFAGFSANGGVSNTLTMGTGNGDMLGNFLGNMQNTIDTGARVRSQQALIERDPSVRAVDQNNDGKFDDADKIDVDGNGRKGFALQGISDQPGELRVYAERVDPRTGQLSQGSTFVVRNGQAERISENDNDTNRPDQNRTLGQSLNASRDPNAAYNAPSPASGPPAPPLTGSL